MLKLITPITDIISAVTVQSILSHKCVTTKDISAYYAPFLVAVQKQLKSKPYTNNQRFKFLITTNGNSSNYYLDID